MKIRLHEIAHCRAGDKGNTSTLSVIAYDEAMYPLLCREVTGGLRPTCPGTSREKWCGTRCRCRGAPVRLPSSSA